MGSSFPDRFGILLDEFDGSAADFAKKLNVSKQTVSAWRSGARSPKNPTIETIARAFHVSVPWLMGLDVDRSPESVPFLTKEDLDLLEIFHQLTPAGRKIVSATAEATLSQAEFREEEDLQSAM